MWRSKDSRNRVDSKIATDSRMRMGTGIEETMRAPR